MKLKGLPEHSRIIAAGIPYQGKVTDGVYTTPKNVDLNVATPGPNSRLIKRPLSAPTVSTSLDSANGYIWNEPIVFDPSQVEPTYPVLYLDGNDVPWLLSFEFNKTGTWSYDVSLFVYERYGVFNVDDPEGGTPANVLNDTVSITITPIKDQQIFLLPDSETGINQNDDGSKVLLAFRGSFSGSGLDWPETRWTFVDAELSGIFEMTITGNVNPNNHTGLTLEYSTFKSVEDTSNIQIFEEEAGSSGDYYVNFSCTSSGNVYSSTNSTTTVEAPAPWSQYQEASYGISAWYDENNQAQYLEAYLINSEGGQSSMTYDDNRSVNILRESGSWFNGECTNILGETIECKCRITSTYSGSVQVTTVNNLNRLTEIGYKINGSQIYWYVTEDHWATNGSGSVESPSSSVSYSALDCDQLSPLPDCPSCTGWSITNSIVTNCQSTALISSIITSTSTFSASTKINGTVISDAFVEPTPWSIYHVLRGPRMLNYYWDYVQWYDIPHTGDEGVGWFTAGQLFDEDTSANAAIDTRTGIMETSDSDIGFL